MINREKIVKLLNFCIDNNFELESLQTNENSIKLEIIDKNQLKVNRVDEKIKDIFYPEEFKFKRCRTEDNPLWGKTNSNGRFLLYKTGESIYKIDAKFKTGFGRTYDDVLIGSRKVAEGVFEKVGCLDD